jgi:triacylglycerol esterase/lipase EstA (alpha/beta hydrolase family)
MRRANGVCGFLALVSVAGVALFSEPGLSQTPTPTQSKPTVHVYLVRGLLNVFSLGLDSIADKLRRHGIEATVHNHLEWPALVGEAVEACKSGRESQIMLVGHSLGASSVVDMANSMGQAGVQESLVVSIDPVVRDTATGYVSRLVNYYVSNGVGQPVDRGPGFHGVVQNVDLKNTPEGGHFMTNSDAIQQRVINDVLAAVHSVRAGCRVGATQATQRPAPVATAHVPRT